MLKDMKTAVFLSILIASIAPGQTPKATATWITSKTSNTAGPIQTVVHMKISDGWHTYWKNPGEGGIPLSIHVELPEHWTMDDIQYPAPKHFTTGELPSIGYEDDVLFPLTLHPPKGMQGNPPQIRATLSWLTCNDSSCVPGEANMTLNATADEALIRKAYDALPKPLAGAKLEFVADKKQIRLILRLPENSEIKPPDYEVFPVTPDVVSAASKLRFNAMDGQPNTWVASGKSSEYIDPKIQSVVIELFKSGGAAWSVSSSR